MWCHLLLLMPAIGLGFFVILPLQLALPTYAIVSATSVLIYYKIMQAMRQPVHSGREALLGGIATVVIPMNPTGQVRYRNELWSAVSEEKLKACQRVKVLGLEGVKLVVGDAERMGSQPERSPARQGSRFWPS